MYDLLVKNGLVANEYNVLPLDVAVKDEKVVALAIHGALDERDATYVIDARGKYVLPGGIDPHVHYDISISEAMTAQTPVAGSRAGLYGGTTTYIDFSLQAGEESLLESIQGKMAHTEAQNPHADYALHAIMSGDWPLKNAEMMAEAISGGVISHIPSDLVVVDGSHLFGAAQSLISRSEVVRGQGTRHKITSTISIS